MSTLHTVFSTLRILVSYGPGLLLIVMLHETIRFQRPDIVDKMNRVHGLDADEIFDVYDFIIIGGGSAGAVLANRLSEINNWHVLLIEAGPDESYISEIPLLYPSLQKSRLDWEYETEPSDSYCLAMDNQQCSWPRGKVLGGCSVLNAMLYIRGNRKDYDRWAELGKLDLKKWRKILLIKIVFQAIQDGTTRTSYIISKNQKTPENIVL